MNDQEKIVMDHTVRLWNDFLKLPAGHPDDQQDVRFHIHAIQNILYARSHVRSLFTGDHKRYIETTDKIFDAIKTQNHE